jgi:diguanylate cyclase (GGDEF)-like protein/PAS domain S-box-containing protein
VFVQLECEGISRIGTDGKFAGLIMVCVELGRDETEYIATEFPRRHFVDLLPQSNLVALALDSSGRTLFFNAGLTQLLGEPADELGKIDVLGRFLDQQHRSLSAVLFPDGKRVETLPARIESEFIAGREGAHVLLWFAMPLRDYSGEQSGIILIGDDLTQSRLAEQQLRLTAKVFDTDGLAMIITDTKGTILSVNSAFSQLTGYSKEEAVGSNPRMLQSGRHDQSFYQSMWAAMVNEGRWQGDIWDKRKDGTVYPKYLSVHALRNEIGEVTHYSGIFFDISERKTAEERLNKLAHFDSLTELPNRRHFVERLSFACHHAAQKHEPVALLYIDLDRFKSVNDTIGHHAGDALLRETGKRLRVAIRSQDLAARIGGDEFAVMLVDVKEQGNAVTVARKILESFQQAVVIDGHPIKISPSIGIALCPDHAEDTETLMRMADKAMYRAKAAGRNGYCLYEA